MFKAGDKVRRKPEYTVVCNNPALSHEVVTIKGIWDDDISFLEVTGSYDIFRYDLVEQPSETIGFETKVLQAIAKGVLSNDQQMIAELVIKRDILQKEIERLNQQIYAKQADVNRLTKLID